LEKWSDLYNQYITEYNSQNGTEFPDQIVEELQQRFKKQFPKIKQSAIM
jgi:hypothetical protein